MGTTTAPGDTVTAAEFGVHLQAERNMRTIPRGRVDGLFGALAMAVCRMDKVKVLPEITVADVRSTRPMFDYDPTLALSLDVTVI